MQHAKLTYGSRTLRVLACDSASERLRGLLGRAEPDPGIALLIDPCWAVHTFGMRYRIDVVFCDANWHVLRTVEALAPRRVAATRGARRVLELRAGSARPLGLVPGTRLTPDTRLRPRAVAAAVQTASAPLLSAPVRGFAAISIIAVCALLLLGACAAPSRTTPAGGRPTTDPLATEELRLQAEIDYASRAWPLAEAGYRALLRKDPGNADYWRRLGTVFLRTNRPNEAIATLDAAVRLAPADPGTLQNLALAHLRAAADTLEHAALAADAKRGPPGMASPVAVATPDALRSLAATTRGLLPPELLSAPTARTP